jgi:hypothetical protein
MVTLIRSADGWSLDLSKTPEAAEIMGLFGTMTLPLPLTTDCSLTQAYKFAQTTDYAMRYGIQCPCQLCGGTWATVIDHTPQYLAARRKAWRA